MLRCIRSLPIVLLFVAQMSHAAEPSNPALPRLGNPAHILDNAAWLKEYQSFSAPGSETRAYSDLVTILYDWDNGRPWGKEYFTEANRRLRDFRELICEATALKICALPDMLTSASDVAAAEASLVDPESMAALEKRWNVKITTWPLPGREPSFTLLVARNSRQEKQTTAFWDLQPRDITVTTYYDELLPEATGYRAGFESQDSPAMIAVRPAELLVNDRQMRLRAAELANVWKHGVVSIRRIPYASALGDAGSIQLLKLFAEQANEFARLYASLRATVASVPQIAARFDAERTRGDYPEEVYQHVAYAQLSSLARTQGLYFALAAEQRPGMSVRARALESMLTLERYGEAPGMLASELLSLLQPSLGRAYVLDENADRALATAYVAANLKAVLGLDQYADRGIYPAGSHGLFEREIFESQGLKTESPRAAEALGGRKIASLGPQEKLQILRLYLEPVPGRVSCTATVRLGILFLLHASQEELQRLAGLVKQRDEACIEP
ncbi:MAG: hypothetical protein U1E61_11910 [Bradyrhizobium sp.]